MNTKELTKNFFSILQDIVENYSIISIVLSHPDKKQSPIKKMTFRPLIIRDQKLYQISAHSTNKIAHHNVSPSECLARLYQDLTESFREAHIYTAEADFHLLISKKGKMTLLKKKPSKVLTPLSHNRKKHYLMEEGQPVPFLVDLGILSTSGKILEKKRDKFKQINRFLELVDDVISQLKPRSHWNIIDFGCGKAYLTFALYHFLRFQKECKVNLLGLDLKEDVIQQCQDIARRLGYDTLQFKVGNIQDHYAEAPVDMVISLHACDTATDAALEKAIHWNAEAILCVPCCQHELYSQVQNPTLQPLLKYGILKERFSSLVTDAARGQILEMYGYHTQILEFIDLEHTAKNLMIRAIKKETSPANKEYLTEKYFEFTKFLNIKPALESKLVGFGVDTP
jgi:SAM-dependent methyltransferase